MGILKDEGLLDFADAIRLAEIRTRELESQRKSLVQLCSKLLVALPGASYSAVTSSAMRCTDWSWKHPHTAIERTLNDTIGNYTGKELSLLVGDALGLPRPDGYDTEPK